MKKNYFILAVALIFCGTSWAQEQEPTSFGGFIDTDPDNNAGTGGNNTNSYFGYQAGFSTTDGFGADGKNNTFIGYQSGFDNSFGHSNTFMGYLSGGNNTNGASNVYVGSFSGNGNENGNGNVFIGTSTGFNAQGSNNVFIGTSAGRNEIGSNLLYIDNSDTSSPLIWGNFSTNALRFNGSVRITDIPQNNGLTRVLVAENDGDIHWRDVSSIGDERTDEEIRDVVGAMVSGNTETRISVTYDDAGNEFDFVVEGDLSAYNNDVGFITSPDDADADPTNEIQSLAYDDALHSVSITGGNAISIAPFPSYPASAGDSEDNTNSFFGHEAGFLNDIGDSNTFIGGRSGWNNTEGFGNTFLGLNSGFNNTEGFGNTFLGLSSGLNNTMGSQNTFIGRGSGYNNNGNHNTFLGLSSGYQNQTGSGNVFLGNQAGYNEMGSNRLYIDNSGTGSPLLWGDFENDIVNINGTIGIGLNPDGDDAPTQALDVQGTARLREIPENSLFTRVLVADTDGNIAWRTDSSFGDANDTPSYPESAGDDGGNTNSFFGHLTGSITTGADNTLVGFQSGLNNTTGYENSSLGSRTLENNTTGARNTANGVFTLFGNTMGNENTAVGYAALGFNTTGSYNTATGFQTLLNNGGDYNTANGYQALLNNTEGDNNTAIGHNSLRNNTNGFNNVAIGLDALLYNETGMNNIAIGTNSGPTFGNFDLANTIAIGSNVSVIASNQVRIGNFEVEDIGGAATWTVVSDRRFKINIEEDVAGLDFIKTLRPVSYNLDRRKIRAFIGNNHATNSDVSKKTVGFIAQEVEQAVQENGYVFTGVKTPTDDKDHYGLKYAEFVVPLTKAVQELSAINDSMQERIEAQDARIQALEERLASLDNGNTERETSGEDTLLSEDNTTQAGFALYQNVPNPFDQTTSITTLIPERVSRAELVIYNLQGLELERYDIRERGQVTTVISGDRFPSGMYIYALLADDELIATKKMVLKK